jgi:hypothetical protein
VVGVGSSIILVIVIFDEMCLLLLLLLLLPSIDVWPFITFIHFIIHVVVVVVLVVVVGSTFVSADRVAMTEMESRKQCAKL